MSKSFSSVAIGLFVALAVGCGSSEPSASVSPASGRPESSPNATSPGAPATASSGRQAEQVVSQFLDRIRRGGTQAAAEELLTTAAREEIGKVGGVQSLGAPDARFTVTRSQPVPAQDGESLGSSMLVHSVWTEPVTAANGSETAQETQVVWAVQRERGNWRISGMVIELVPGQPATVIDFENGRQLAQLFGQFDDTPQARPSVATDPSAARNR